MGRGYLHLAAIVLVKLDPVFVYSKRLLMLEVPFSAPDEFLWLRILVILGSARRLSFVEEGHEVAGDFRNSDDDVFLAPSCSLGVSRLPM